MKTLRAAIRPGNIHFPRPKLLCLKNTYNATGGKTFSMEEFATVTEEVRKRGLKVHLDGAGLFNAPAATGVRARN